MPPANKSTARAVRQVSCAVETIVSLAVVEPRPKTAVPPATMSECPNREVLCYTSLTPQHSSSSDSRCLCQPQASTPEDKYLSSTVHPLKLLYRHQLKHHLRYYRAHINKTVSQPSTPTATMSRIMSHLPHSESTEALSLIASSDRSDLQDKPSPKQAHKASMFKRYRDTKKSGHVPISDDEIKKYTGRTLAEIMEWAKDQPGVAGNPPAERSFASGLAIGLGAGRG